MEQEQGNEEDVEDVAIGAKKDILHSVFQRPMQKQEFVTTVPRRGILQQLAGSL